MCDLAQVYACNESMLSQHTEGNDWMRIPNSVRWPRFKNIVAVKKIINDIKKNNFAITFQL